MAFIPLKMDDSQIAFLANEITKAYMTGKNMGTQVEFIQEYYNMYQSSVNFIREEQRKNQMDIDAMIDNAAAKLDMCNSNGVSGSKMFR